MAGRSVLSPVPYEPPSWARGLRVQPTSRLMLGMCPTPLHTWSLPGVPSGFQVTVKREDLTGSILTGNKVRKLEFLLADALQQGCDLVVTFGGLQSNHARATALAARQVGLPTHLVALCSTETLPSEVQCCGNMLLDLLAGTKVLLVQPRTDISRDDHVKIIHTQLEHYAAKLRSEGHRPYVIPAGGSSAMGTWGYIEAFKEMMEQGVLEGYDDVVVASGSAGTACGLAVSNYLTGSKVRLHAVATHSSSDYIHSVVDAHLHELGMESVTSKEIVDVVEGYVGDGLNSSTKEQTDLILNVFLKTGLSLDLDFTVKAVRGMLEEMKNNPSRFQGKRVLFIHTGGVFSLFDGRINQAVRENPATSQILHLSDLLPD